MPKTIRIRNTDSEMDSVRVFLEENLKLDSREKEMTCLLICATLDARIYQRLSGALNPVSRWQLFRSCRCSP